MPASTTGRARSRRGYASKERASTTVAEGRRSTPSGLALRHARGTTTAGAAVFCAGLWSDRIAVACGAPKSPRIVPFRGAMLVELYARSAEEATEVLEDAAQGQLEITSLTEESRPPPHASDEAH
jgi:hypothetical protein